MSSSLRAFTYRIDQDLPVFDVGARSGLVWSREGFLLAGVGEAARIGIDRPGGYAAAAVKLAAVIGQDVDHDGVDELRCPGSGPVAFSALPFDPDAPGELIVPEMVLGANQSGMRWLTVIEPPSTGRDRDTTIGTAMETINRLLETEPDAAAPTSYQLRSPLPPEHWRDQVVATARNRINDGELIKAVLAREAVLTTDQPIQTSQVIQRLSAVFPAAALFLIDGFIGASPELLVARSGDMVRAHPLAGTAPRSTDPVIDQRQTAGLLASDKDRWEHRITIDWLLDTLLPFCSYVDAEPEPSIVTLANVHHLGTRVEGRLSSPAAPILELVAGLHPTPAVGGSPQKDALILIDQLEQAERGRYAGPVGWLDAAGNGEFAVAVRSAEVKGTEARFFAGVGVVGDSDPAAELEETRAKFKAMLGALIVP